MSANLTIKHERSWPVWPLIGALVLAVVGSGGLGYLYYREYQTTTALTTTLAEERDRAAEAAALASTTLAALTTELQELRDDYTDLEDDYREERDRNEAFQDEIDRVTDTVRDLDKLAKLDKELLAKYSKVYFLNENYVPDKLTRIPAEHILAGKDEQFIHTDVLPFLEDLLKAAARDNVDLKVVSAFRSFDNQQFIKGEFTQTYGEGANTFSADQGYSEHQLGTTVDLTDPATGGTYESFAATDAYSWLLEHAHRYGFILSYPHDNTFYVFEPWHWRFVGTDLARDLHQDGADFYDWPQREIDSYLIKIFD